MTSGDPQAPAGQRHFRSAAEQRAAYLEGHRTNPLTMTRVGGRLLSASQIPWFTLLPPKGYGVLTTVGRKTGKRRRKCVRAVRDGNKAYLVSLRGDYGAWIRNARTHPLVQLRIRGGTFKGRVRDIRADEYLRAREMYCGTVNRFDRMEYRMHRTGRPRREAIEQLHTHWFSVGTPLVVDLADEDDGRPS